jgi:hypothetical protein
LVFLGPAFWREFLTKMTDPSDALKSFQQALVDGEIQLQRGQIDPGLFVHLDRPNGQPRFTYVRLQRQTVNERPRETLQFETPQRDLTPVLRRPVEPAGKDRTSRRRSVLSFSGLVRISRIYNGTRDMRDLLVDGP